MASRLRVSAPVRGSVSVDAVAVLAVGVVGAGTAAVVDVVAGSAGRTRKGTSAVELPTGVETVSGPWPSSAPNGTTKVSWEPIARGMSSATSASASTPPTDTVV